MSMTKRGRKAGGPTKVRTNLTLNPMTLDRAYDLLEPGASLSSLVDDLLAAFVKKADRKPAGSSQ